MIYIYSIFVLQNMDQTFIDEHHSYNQQLKSVTIFLLGLATLAIKM
jgi:hypothetical protein